MDRPCLQSCEGDFADGCVGRDHLAGLARVAPAPVFGLNGPLRFERGTSIDGSHWSSWNNRRCGARKEIDETEMSACFWLP